MGVIPKLVAEQGSAGHCRGKFRSYRKEQAAEGGFRNLNSTEQVLFGIHLVNHNLAPAPLRASVTFGSLGTWWLHMELPGGRVLSDQDDPCLSVCLPYVSWVTDTAPHA